VSAASVPLVLLHDLERRRLERRGLLSKLTALEAEIERLERYEAEIERLETESETAS
jgi:hypothetical protein